MRDSLHPEVEKLFRSVQKHGSQDTAMKIAFGTELSKEASDAEKAAWVRHITHGLEEAFDEEAVKSIRAGCHCNDRLEDMKTWLGGLYRESSDIADFVARVNEHGAGWYVEDGAIFTKFTACECYMLRDVDSLESRTWCQCTLGYTKSLFGSVFGHDVDVELVRTIKMGNDFCLVKVIPRPR